MRRETAAVFLLMLFSSALAQSQSSICFYQSKAFAADVTFQKHGITCQQCSTQAGGSWIDKLQGCERFSEKEVPGAQPPSTICSDTDGLTYSEGAIVSTGSECMRCQSKHWFQLDTKAFCHK
jgi:hypothetical protein